MMLERALADRDTFFLIEKLIFHLASGFSSIVASVRDVFILDHTYIRKFLIESEGFLYKM